ncbi:MAG TPA: NAD(P)/FAD-dependent oxidoreductase [Jatrophihabitans sp.]|nr:NAD(P)/FAD-dependent oxidoreductase [Jatrophihabitans sp.]
MSGEAVVIGAGHNGLVAATMLADAGWDVTVLEQQDRLGGAVYSDRSLHPDYVTDWYSAFYPLAAASPVINALDLGEHGLRWSHAPAVLAHVLPDDSCALLSRDLDTTAAALEEFAPGDGDAWRKLVGEFNRIREPVLRALLTPFPPVRPAAALARVLGTADLLRFVRMAVQPVRRAGDELFDGEGARLLLAGNALHTDLPPESAGSAIYGWLLAMLGQVVGFPVPSGGSGALIDALRGRLEAAGGSVRTGAWVRRIEVHGGAVHGVVLDGGERIATRTVLADVAATHLFQELVEPGALPPRLLDDISRFEWDSPTMKVDWALAEPIPWTAKAARGAGTVHLGVDMNGLTRYAAALATRDLPDRPFLVLGQMTTADASRSPAGTESAWAYTHMPGGPERSPEEIEAYAQLIEQVVEKHAPGFGALIRARRIQSPADLEASEANLVRGAVNGGTANLHQQLVFRPVPGLGRPETPIDGLYLASASAHPGGGVHGGPGANAARAALRRSGLTGSAHRRAIDWALRRIYR